MWLRDRQAQNNTKQASIANRSLLKSMLDFNKPKYQDLAEELRRSPIPSQHVPEEDKLEMCVIMGCILRLVESEPARFRETTRQNSPPGSVFVLDHSLEDLNRALLTWQSYWRSRTRTSVSKKYSFSGVPKASREPIKDILQFAEEARFAREEARDDDREDAILSKLDRTMKTLPVGLSVPPAKHLAIYLWQIQTDEGRGFALSRHRRLVGHPRERNKCPVVALRNGPHLEAVRLAFKALNPGPLSPTSIIPAMTVGQHKHLYCVLRETERHTLFGKKPKYPLIQLRPLPADDAFTVLRQLVPDVLQARMITEEKAIQIENVMFHNIPVRLVVENLHATTRQLRGLIFRPHENLTRNEDMKPEMDGLTCETLAVMGISPLNAVMLEATAQNAALFLAKNELQACIDKGQPFEDETDCGAAFWWRNVVTDTEDRAPPPISRLSFAQSFLMWSPIMSAVVSRALEIVVPSVARPVYRQTTGSRLVIVADYELIQQ